MPDKVELGDLSAKFKLGVDEAGRRSVISAFKELDSAVGNFEKNLGRIAGAPLRAISSGVKGVVQGFENVVRVVGDVGSKIGNAINLTAQLTAGIRSQLIAAQNAYTQSIDKSEQSSRDLLEAQYQLRSAQIDLGRIAGQVTLPAIQLQAAAARDLVNFLKQNPQIAGPAIGAAGVVGAAEQARQAFGGGRVGGFAGAAVLGVGALGVASQATAGQTGILGSIHNVLASGFEKAVGAIEKIAPNTAEALRGFGGGGAGARPGEAGREGVVTSPFIGQAVELVKQQQRAATEFEIQQGRQREENRIQRGRQEAQFQLQQNRQLEDMARDFGRQFAKEERELEHNRLLENRNFARQLFIQERDFNRQRVRELRDQGIALQREDAAYAYSRYRAELAFNIDRENQQRQFEINERRAREDHGIRLLDFAASQDALAIFKENRQEKVRAQRAGEDFQLQRYLANQQFQISLKDEKYQFDLQRKYRLEDFARRIKDENQDFEWRIQQEKDDIAHRQQLEKDALAWRRGQEALDFNLRLEDMKRAQDRFRADLNLQYGYQLSDFNRQLGYFRTDQSRQLGYQLFDLDYHLVTTRKAYNDYYDYTRRALGVWIGDIQAQVAGASALAAYERNLTNEERRMIGLPPLSGSGGGRGRAEGGYMPPGTYDVSERGIEFALSAQTTRQAELAVGGRLTQEKLLAGMRYGGLGGGGGLTIQQNYTFNGSFTEGDRAWFRQTAREQAVDALATAVQKVNERGR